MSVLARRLLGALTDLGYMTLSASPRLRPLYRRWARRRYRGLAPLYGNLADDDPAYLLPLRTALRHLDGEPQLVVEVGAGTGAATALLLERFPGATVVAVDLSRRMLQQLRSPGATLHRVVGDAFALPLRAHAADIILVHNAPFDLDEALRATRPSGLVLIVLSSARWIPSSLRTRLLRGYPPGEPRAIGAGVAWVFPAWPDRGKKGM